MSTDDGLVPKYRVERLADPTGKHAGCRYFVLDPRHDPIALSALAEYATRARQEGYVALAEDLRQWINEIWIGDHHG